MFWNEQFPEHIADIDILLQMPDVSVRDLLWEDDILQECKTSNPKLIEFLTKNGSIADLVDNVTSLSESKSTNASLRSLVHSAYVSCEILTSGVSEITHALFSDKNSIEKILSCLVTDDATAAADHDKPHTPVPLGPNTTSDENIAGPSTDTNTGSTETTTSSVFIELVPLKTTFIGKLIKFMHSQRSEDFFCYITRDETNTFKKLIDFLLDHIDLSGSLEILEALMDDTDPREIRLSYCALLEKENIICRLIDILSQSESEDKQKNAGQLLCDIIRIGRQVSSTDATENNSSEFFHDPLLKILESTETISILLNKIFLNHDGSDIDLQKASPTTLICGMNVLQSILEYKRHNILHGRNLDLDRFQGSHQTRQDYLENTDFFDNNDKDSGYSDSVDASMLAKAISQAQAAIEDRLHYFHKLLIKPPRQEPIRTTFGLIEKPLGYARLEVIHLLRALISTNSPNIIKKIVDLKTIKCIVDLFIEYPWNNLLHTQVEQSLCLIINNYRRDADKHFVETATTTVAEAAAAAVTLAASHSTGKDDTEASESAAESSEVALINDPLITSAQSQQSSAQQSQQEMPSQLLLTQLLGECDLIQRIIPSEIDLKRERSPEQANFGHIVQIASYISINSDLDPIKDHLSDMNTNRPELYQRWKTFIDVHVASFNATSTKFTAPRPFIKHNNQSINFVNQRETSSYYHNVRTQSDSPQDDEEELVTRFFSYQTQEVTPNIYPDAIPKMLKPRRGFSCFPEL